MRRRAGCGCTHALTPLLTQVATITAWHPLLASISVCISPVISPSACSLSSSTICNADSRVPSTVCARPAVYDVFSANLTYQQSYMNAYVTNEHCISKKVPQCVWCRSRDKSFLVRYPPGARNVRAQVGRLVTARMRSVALTYLVRMAYTSSVHTY